MLFKMFKRAMDLAGAVEPPLAICLIVQVMPKNMRQYYADKLMLMMVELQYGI